MGSWTMHIFCAAPGYVAASTDPESARGGPGHWLNIPRKEKHPFCAPASERWCLSLELQGMGFWQVHLPELEVVQGSGFNTLALVVGEHQASRA